MKEIATPQEQHQALVHASCVQIHNQAILIIGQSGAGKSALTLRLLDQPGRGLGTDCMTAQLVADDQVKIIREGAMLWAEAPAPLKGLIEVRGLGILHTIATTAPSPVACVISLDPQWPTERWPAPEWWEILGLKRPLYRLNPNAPHVLAQVRVALELPERQIQE